MENFSCKYFLFGGLAITVSICAGYFGYPLIAGNTEARGVIVTVFSILAGFLIAVMSLYGNPAMMSGKWTQDAAQIKNVHIKLIRHKWLFVLYLLTLLVIFVSTLVEKSFPDATEWFERGYFSLSVLAFFCSFTLPSSLLEIQMSILEAVVGTTKKKTSKLER